MTDSIDSMPVEATPSGTVLKRFLLRHPVVTFLLMGMSFLGMGLITLNLIYVFHANLEYILDNGVMGLRDGGLLQLLQLIGNGIASLLLYLLFKVCEKVLVDRLLERRGNAKS